MYYNCSGSITGQCCDTLPQAAMRNLKSDDRLKQPCILWRACIFSVYSIYFWLKELSKEYTKNSRDQYVIMCNDPDFMIQTFVFIIEFKLWEPYCAFLTHGFLSTFYIFGQELLLKLYRILLWWENGLNKALITEHVKP